MELEFDITMDAGTLYDYMLHHTYGTFQGLFGTGVGALMIIGFGATGYVLWLIGGIIILAYLPCTLFLKSRQQMLANPAFKRPLHFRMTEEGVEISQGEKKEFQKWKDMVKATSTTKSIILYTSSINASVFPRKALGEKEVLVIEMICKHMEPGKVKIKQ